MNTPLNGDKRHMGYNTSCSLDAEQQVGRFTGFECFRKSADSIKHFFPEERRPQIAKVRVLTRPQTNAIFMSQIRGKKVLRLRHNGGAFRHRVKDLKHARQYIWMQHIILVMKQNEASTGQGQARIACHRLAGVRHRAYRHSQISCELCRSVGGGIIYNKDLKRRLLCPQPGNGLGQIFFAIVTGYYDGNHIRYHQFAP